MKEKKSYIHHRLCLSWRKAALVFKRKTWNLGSPCFGSQSPVSSMGKRLCCWIGDHVEIVGSLRIPWSECTQKLKPEITAVELFVAPVIEQVQIDFIFFFLTVVL